MMFNKNELISSHLCGCIEQIFPHVKITWVANGDYSKNQTIHWKRVKTPFITGSLKNPQEYLENLII